MLPNLHFKYKFSLSQGSDKWEFYRYKEKEATEIRLLLGYNLKVSAVLNIQIKDWNFVYETELYKKVEQNIVSDFNFQWNKRIKTIKWFNMFEFFVLIPFLPSKESIIHDLVRLKKVRSKIHNRFLLLIQHSLPFPFTIHLKCYIKG